MSIQLNIIQQKKLRAGNRIALCGLVVHKMNSDAWGDSPCNMISASIVNVCESKEEICDYCNYNGIFAEIYTE